MKHEQVTLKRDRVKKKQKRCGMACEAVEHLPDAYGQCAGLLVQASVVQLHAAVVQVHAVDQLVVWTIIVLSLHAKTPSDCTLNTSNMYVLHAYICSCL